MSNIKLAHMGVSYLDGMGTGIGFECDDYLLDYDFIVASAAEIVENLNILHELMNDDPDRQLTFLNKRVQDLKDFYHHGGTLVLLIDDNPVCDDLQGIPEFKHGKVIELLSTRSAKINYTLQNGRNVQYHPVAGGLADMVDVYFKAILNHTGTNTLLRTQRTGQALSYHRKVNNGLFVALPDFALKTPDNPDTPAQLFAHLTQICQALKQPQLQIA